MNVLEVKLVPDYVDIVAVKWVVCCNVHHTQRLTVFKACAVSCRTSQNNYLQNFLHVSFKLFVYHVLIANRIIAKVDTLRSVLVNASNKILIYFLSDERYHRSCTLAERNDSSVKSHVSVYLVL